MEYNWFSDDRGDSVFDLFVLKDGQVNVSVMPEGIVKGVHQHDKQVDRVACIQGKILALTSDEGQMVPERTVLSPMNREILTIPKGKLHGFKALAPNTIMVYHVSRGYDQTDPDEKRFNWDYWGKDAWDIEFK